MKTFPAFLEHVKIYLAMYDIERYTCAVFKTRKNEEGDYLHIKPGKGCSSNLGRIGGKQTVTLQQNGCMSRGTIIHELIHALGYDHMHSHSDRDKFVSIVYDNVESKNLHNFEKYATRLRVKFEFKSLIHLILELIRESSATLTHLTTSTQSCTTIRLHLVRTASERSFRRKRNIEMSSDSESE